MTIQQLQNIERAVGFRYPSSFVSTFEEFSALFRNDAFHAAFPETRLLLSAPEIAAAREDIPLPLLPFMHGTQPSWSDIYAFDLDSGDPEFRVVVWSDHAIVMDWECFLDFFHWIRDHIVKHHTGD